VDTVTATHVESARYALLRRIAPSLRHKLMGALHPISLLAGVAARQAEIDASGDSVRECAAKIRMQTQAATGATLAALAWITDEERPAVAADEAIAACVTLVRSEFEMRGIAIDANGVVNAHVPSRPLREVFLGALFAATDGQDGSQVVQIRAQRVDDTVEIALETRRKEAINDVVSRTERCITWLDLEALAVVNGCRVTRAGPRTILQLPLAAKEASPDGVRRVS
jgi:hypothetical protein